MTVWIKNEKIQKIRSILCMNQPNDGGATVRLRGTFSVNHVVSGEYTLIRFITRKATWITVINEE